MAEYDGLDEPLEGLATVGVTLAARALEGRARHPRGGRPRTAAAGSGRRAGSGGAAGNGSVRSCAPEPARGPVPAEPIPTISRGCAVAITIGSGLATYFSWVGSTTPAWSSYRLALRGARWIVAVMIELSDVIASLRSDLDTARREGAGKDLRFELGPVELEVSVAVEKTAGGGAKVKFWVAELGADGKVGSTSTQRIKLTLNPKLTEAAAAADPTRLADRSPFVHGKEVAGEQ